MLVALPQRSKLQALDIVGERSAHVLMALADLVMNITFLECPIGTLRLRLGRTCLENIFVFFTIKNLQIVSPPVTWPLS